MFFRFDYKEVRYRRNRGRMRLNLRPSSRDSSGETIPHARKALVLLTKLREWSPFVERESGSMRAKRRKGWANRQHGVVVVVLGAKKKQVASTFSRCTPHFLQPTTNSSVSHKKACKLAGIQRRMELKAAQKALFWLPF